MRTVHPIQSENTCVIPLQFGEESGFRRYTYICSSVKIKSGFQAGKGARSVRLRVRVGRWRDADLGVGRVIDAVEALK